MKSDYNDDPYMRVLSDLKMIMKKKMIEDKLHKSQHKSLDMKKEDPEDESYEEEDDYGDEKMDFMKNRAPSKDGGSGLLMMLSAKPSKKGGKSSKKMKGKGKKYG